MGFNDNTDVERSAVVRFLTEKYRGLAAFVRQCLSAKKILVISDKGISSIPISTRSQTITLSIAIIFMLWVSYSTGKYFAYEGVINEKDREIWSSNVTNENLQYKVSDLHENLAQLNSYFENIQNLDQLSSKKIVDEENNKKAEKAEDGTKTSALEADENQPYGKVQKLLFNIRDKVVERISNLEHVVQTTGMKLENLAENNTPLNRSLVRYRENQSQVPQGGPYNPLDTDVSIADRENLVSEVQYLMELEKLVHGLPLAAPMRRFWISSGFGKRHDPYRKRMAMHQGIDLVGKFREKIVSSAPGTVIYARSFGAYGRFVEIDHGSGITTRYSHMHKILVKRGQKVERGDVIGIQGSTGRSTGDHLHYEVRYDNKPLDPKPFLKAGKYVF